MNKESNKSGEQQTAEHTKFLTDIRDFGISISEQYEPSSDEDIDPEGDTDQKHNVVFIAGERQGEGIAAVSLIFGDKEALTTIIYQAIKGNLELTEAFLSAASRSYSDYVKDNKLTPLIVGEVSNLTN